MEKTLKLTAMQAIALLGKDEAFDALIRANFTEQELSLEMSDRIKTLEDALDFNGKTKVRFQWETERDTDQQKATKEWEEIAQALRGGKELSLTDKWYYPWMKRNAGSGSRFSYGDSYYELDRALVGARLCVDTAKNATYLGTQFPDILTRALSPKSK